MPPKKVLVVVAVNVSWTALLNPVSYRIWVSSFYPLFFDDSTLHHKVVLDSLSVCECRRYSQDWKATIVEVAGFSRDESREVGFWTKNGRKQERNARNGFQYSSPSPTHGGNIDGARTKPCSRNRKRHGEGAIEKKGVEESVGEVVFLSGRDSMEAEEKRKIEVIGDSAEPRRPTMQMQRQWIPSCLSSAAFAAAIHKGHSGLRQNGGGAMGPMGAPERSNRGVR